uniref:Myb_DNA-bind_5 domain-containing protein n=2 Tax=Caenorhabditis tropicalis TaxID=1561998 RepID=A0A1I7T262_9PELO
MYTDPNCWSSFLWFTMKRLPARFAPSYDPISMWTREEVKEIQKLPKDQREMLKEQMLPLNKRLFLSHKWDLLLNEKLENGGETSEVLLEILRNEVKLHHDLSGTQFQKQQLQEAFAEFVKSVSERQPRMNLTGVNAKSEMVTLCAEKEDGTANVTNFMLIPDIDVFEPEEFYEEINDIDKRRTNMEIDKETYKIAREEAVSQNKFMNSAIKFKYYGKIKS